MTLRSFVPTSRPGWWLALGLASLAMIVRELEPHLGGESRRFYWTLVVLGFFFAPRSTRELRPLAWFLGVALVGWGAQLASLSPGSSPLTLVLSLGGALVSVRGGERASELYLPPASNELGQAHRARIRRELQGAVVSFLAVYLLDGQLPTSSRSFGLELTRSLVLLTSAILFIRYILLQSHHLGLSAVAPFRRVEAKGLVVGQRWPYLLVLGLIGWSGLPARLFERLGTGSERILMQTAGFMVFLATAFFVAALVRLQRHRRIDRPSVRIVSFVAGIGLSVALAVVVVDLRPEAVPTAAIHPAATLGVKRVAFFAITFFLVLLPFIHERTGLVVSHPRLAFFASPTLVALMNAPLVAINGPERWALASTEFLYLETLLVVGYFWVVSLRERAPGRLYLSTLLALLASSLWWRPVSGAPSDAEKLFVASLGLALYGLNVFERSGALHSQE